MWFGVITNLGVLGFFKYYNFFVSQFQKLFEVFGFHSNVYLLKIIIPVGISFYTFHGMSYILDIYFKRIKPVNSFIDYAVFVSFFPLLVAGPIERANHLLPQIQSVRIFRYSKAVIGIRMIIWGLFKKIVIADSLSIVSNNTLSNYLNYDGWIVLVGAIAFSFQIYCDFSGYSDIARGTAKILGFDLLENFKFPYFSINMVEFWQRWHISLSSWFRDYVYIPLGGSQYGELLTIRNVFIVFLLSGLWHGASWNFIAWGFLHAFALISYKILIAKSKLKYTVELKLIGFFKTILTFLFITLTWVLFQADSLSVAIGTYRKIFSEFRFSYSNSTTITFGNTHLNGIWIYIIILFLVEFKFKSDESLSLSRYKLIDFFLNYLMLFSIFYFYSLSHEFIYFSF